MKTVRVIAIAASFTVFAGASAGAQQAGRSNPPTPTGAPAEGLQMRISKQLPNTKQAAAQQKQRLTQAVAASAQRRATGEGRKEETR